MAVRTVATARRDGQLSEGAAVPHPYHGAMTTAPDTAPLLKVALGDRELLLRMPSEDQLLSLTLMTKTKLPETTQIEIVSSLIFSLTVNDDDTAAILTALARGDAQFLDIMNLFHQAAERLKEIAAEKKAGENTATSDGAAAQKRTVKRTAAAKTVSGRKRPTKA